MFNVIFHLLTDLFVGQLKSSLTCTACGFRSTVFDPFWDLSIPIAQVTHTHTCACSKMANAVFNYACLHFFTFKPVISWKLQYLIISFG